MTKTQYFDFLGKSHFPQKNFFLHFNFKNQLILADFNLIFPKGQLKNVHVPIFPLIDEFFDFLFGFLRAWILNYIIV